MKLELSPELKRFVDQQVQAGRFSSADEVVEAGLARLMLDPAPDTVDQAEAEEIRASLDEMARGEVAEWKAHAVEVRKRFGL